MMVWGGELVEWPAAVDKTGLAPLHAAAGRYTCVGGWGAQSIERDAA